MSDNINSDIRKMAEENSKKILEAMKKVRTAARKKAAVSAERRAAAARKNAAVEAGRARVAAKTMKPKRTPQRPKTESAKRTPQRPKSGSVYQTPKTSPSPKSRNNNNNNLNMENQLEQNQKNSDELEEWAEKNKTKTKIRNFDKKFEEFKNEVGTNIKITKQSRDLAKKLKPEFKQALKTNKSTNNKNAVNIAVQAAEKKYPYLEWNKITKDIITPMVNEIKGFIDKRDLQKALRVIVPLIFTVYLNLTPRFMNLIIRGGIGSLSKYFPFMAPISNTSSAWYKRLHAFIIYTSNPTKERMMYETAMAPFPRNKYGRSFLGVITQFITIAVTFMMAAIPIDNTGVSQAFFQILLQLIQFSTPLVFGNVVEVLFQGTKQTGKLSWQALTAVLKLGATVGAGAIAGPVGAGAGALVTMGR